MGQIIIFLFPVDLTLTHLFINRRLEMKKAPKPSNGGEMWTSEEIKCLINIYIGSAQTGTTLS